MKEEAISSRVVRKATSMLRQAHKRAYQLSLYSWHSSAMPRVIFVTGVQRSGTNMMMNILNRSLQTQVYFESNPQAYVRFELKPLETIRELVASSRAPDVVFKALFEAQRINQLLEVFPDTRVLWMLRDYDDVVNSHTRRWKDMARSVEIIATQTDATDGWIGRGMSDETRDRVRALYHPDLTDESAYALFWYFRNILFFEQNLDQDARVALVPYEAAVERIDDIFPKVFEFLGLKYRPQYTRSVFSSSIKKHHQPTIDEPIRALCDALKARFDTLLKDSSSGAADRRRVSV